MTTRQLQADFADALAREDRQAVLELFYALNDRRLTTRNTIELDRGWPATSRRFHHLMDSDTSRRALVICERDHADQVTGAGWTYHDVDDIARQNWSEGLDFTSPVDVAAEILADSEAIEADVCPITPAHPPRWFQSEDGLNSVHFFGPWTDGQRVNVARRADIYGVTR